MKWFQSILKKAVPLCQNKISGQSDELEVDLQDTKGNIIFSILPSRLICANASVNNVVFVYADNQGAVRERKVRCTMNSVLKQFSPHLIRCHRSFLLNPGHLVRFYDVPEDSKVQIYSPRPFEIPVSKTYRPCVIEAVQLLTKRKKDSRQAQ